MFWPNEIIIHCTASPQDWTLDDIRKCHLSRGFIDIGYHFIIFSDGSRMIGRPIYKMGAHCRGHNKNSIGIAWVGGLNGARDMTPQQKFRLGGTILQLGSSLVYPFDTLSTHHFYNSHKSCPNYTLDELFPEQIFHNIFKTFNG